MHRVFLLLLGHSAVTGALVAPLGARVGPSVPLTLQSPRLARPRMADPQETGRDELDEGKMKNINILYSVPKSLEQCLTLTDLF